MVIISYSIVTLIEKVKVKHRMEASRSFIDIKGTVTFFTFLKYRMDVPGSKIIPLPFARQCLLWNPGILSVKLYGKFRTQIFTKRTLHFKINYILKLTLTSFISSPLKDTEKIY